MHFFFKIKTWSCFLLVCVDVAVCAIRSSVFWLRQLVLCKTDQVEDVVSYRALRPVYEDYYLSVSLCFMCIFSGLVWNHQFNAFIKQG